MFELLNEQPFLQQVGDKGVRSLADARKFIIDGPVASYELGHGLFCVERQSDGVSIGICGLLRRDTLEYPDLGYALLQKYWSDGYASEAAAATIRWAFNSLGLNKIVAVTAPDNGPSIALLQKLGFVYEQTVDFRGVSKLYSLHRSVA
ncbi:MAG: GNAT family N-acetyltransferase [Gammaproteobacteria bacterium]|nr:GNAT family N-acetyltransferase [Gammaproteobacteria bacterium]